MRLTVLGCAGSFPGPGVPCSGYLVEHSGFRLLLDFGNGALGELQRRAGLLDVDAVVLSHLHGDHCLDMCAYAVVRRLHPAGRPTRLPVYGPAGTAGRLAAAYDPFAREGLGDVYSFTKIENGSREIGPFTVTFARVNHPVETYASRVSAGGRHLTYSADTGRSQALVDLAEDSDLFLCEATFLHGEPVPPDLHLTGVEAGEHAYRAGAGRLVVTHVAPWTDAVRQLGDAATAFGGPTELAVTGATYEI